MTVLAILFTLAQVAILLVESERTRGLILISYAAVFAVISTRLLLSLVIKFAKEAVKEGEENRKKVWFQQFDYQLVTLAYLGLMMFLYIGVVIKAGIL